MPKRPATIELQSEGVRELIRLTNSQFKDWREALEAAIKDSAPRSDPEEGDASRDEEDKIGAGSLMNYWFILSNLALHSDDDFRLRKKEAFETIPNLSTEAVRKHVSAVEALGLVETVKSKREISLRLTPSGQQAVARTLTKWIRDFGTLHQKHFAKR